MAKKEPDTKSDLLFLNSIDMICVTDTEGRFIKVNPEWKKTLGYSSTELKGVLITELIHPDDIAATWSAINQLIINKKPRIIINRFRHRNGKYCLIKWRWFSYNDSLCASAREVIEENNTEIQSEFRLRSMVENLPIGIGIIDLDGNFKYLNRTFYQYFGYKPEEIPDIKRWAVLAYHDSSYRKATLNIWQKEIDNLSAGKKEYSMPGIFSTRTKSKKTLEIEVTFSLYEKEVYVLFTDVTEKIKAEKGLRESELRLRSFIDKSSEGVVIINEKGVVEEWNLAAETITGILRKNILHHYWWDVVLLIYPHELQSDTIKQRLEKIIKATLKSGRIHLQESELHHIQLPGGEIKYIEQKMFPIKTESGYRLAGIFTDVTDRKKSEELIASERNVLRALVDNIPDIVYVKDTESRFVITNRTLANILDTTVENLIGKTDLELFSHDLASEFFVDEQLLIQTGKPIIDKEETIFDPKGNKVILQTTKLPLRDKAGKITGFVGTGHIITERKQYEEALKRRVLALTRPLDEIKNIDFTDLFSLEDIQRIQDTFANATGVGSLITYPDGTPITKPSNFCRFCNLIRSTEKGQINCMKSDMNIGATSSKGPTVMPCYSGGLWDAGASITIGGVHLANWFIGQIRNEAQDFDKMLNYADEIGIDRKIFSEALEEVPVMSKQQFERVAQSLFVLANEISLKAYQNIQQARFIAEHRQAEEALKKSEEQLKGITQNIPGVVFQLSTTGNNHFVLNYASENAIRYTGIENKNLQDVFDHFIGSIKDEDRQNLISSIRKAANSLTRLEWEGRFIKPNGELAILNIMSQPRKLENEIVLDGLILDITKQKNAEKEIEKLAALNQTVIDTVSVGLIFVRDRKIEWANSAFFSMFGYEVSEGYGLDASFLYAFKEDYLRLVKESYEIFFTNAVYTDELLAKRKDGSVFWVNIVGKAIVPDKSIEGTIWMIQDISERKQAEEKIRKLNADLENRVYERTIQLEQANRDLETFAYSVSHDLRSPIRHIDGFVKLMYSKISERSDLISDYYNKIEAASQRMSSMIDSLLTFSRLGRKGLSLSLTDLQSVVNEIVEEVKPDIGKRDIKWNISQLPKIQCDRSLMKMAIENLISNAVKYTSRKKHAVITIDWKPISNSQIELCVKDNGAGFDMAYASKLFGVFQRLHTSEEFEGIGIGLANVRQIVEKHKGTVRADGKPDEGAAFYITLPK